MNNYVFDVQDGCFACFSMMKRNFFLEFMFDNFCYLLILLSFGFFMAHFWDFFNDLIVSYFLLGKWRMNSFFENYIGGWKLL
jgi:hypothetical protein